MKFNNAQEFQKFLDESQICICGKLLTGLHELTCPKIQKLKVKFMGKQDSHPLVKVPKVTD